MPHPAHLQQHHACAVNMTSSATIRPACRAQHDSACTHTLNLTWQLLVSHEWFAATPCQLPPLGCLACCHVAAYTDLTKKGYAPHTDLCCCLPNTSKTNTYTRPNAPARTHSRPGTAFACLACIHPANTPLADASGKQCILPSLCLHRQDSMEGTCSRPAHHCTPTQNESTSPHRSVCRH